MLLARQLRRASATATTMTMGRRPLGGSGTTRSWSTQATRSGHGVGGDDRGTTTRTDSPLAGDFAALGINPKLTSALGEMGIAIPTGIQRKSIPAILSRKDILCTAQTGTGKTLAYMIPVVEQVHRAERDAAAAVLGVEGDNDDRRQRLTSRPQVLVLLPSRELALQVGDVAKQLAHTAKFSSTTVTSGERKSIQQKSLARPLDMVIGTPGRVAKCIAKGDFFVSRVTTIVLDEADTLLDAKMGFRKELEEVLSPIQASAAKRQEPLQFVLVAATIRSPLDKVVKKRFGDLRLVSDTEIHQTPSTLQEEFMRTTPEAKQSALREALHLRRLRDAKTIVFCRNAASCRATDHMLREHGFRSLCLHGDMPVRLREMSVERFQSKQDSVDVLVCTDLAARGLHFDHVKHVVMFDFPKSAVDYVHRAGRAGRAGEAGFVTCLVTKHDLPLARSIEEASASKQSIRELRTDVEDIVAAVDSVENAPKLRRPPASSLSKSPRIKKKAIVGHGTKRLKKHKLRTQ